MPNGTKTYPTFDHDAYARTRAADDFWGQVRRTVQGVPVADDQIQMIVAAIRSALAISADDTLLDLACGNGALAHLLFDSCAAYLGVDLSEHLIAVAKAHFEALPRRRFLHCGADEYVRTESRPERFTKVLCYGSFQYFPATGAAEVLRTLFDKFAHVESVFIGNLPDKTKAAEFYKAPPNNEELADCHSQIGIWRTRDEFAQLAHDAGWHVQFSNMPDNFYASYYRYDALLRRQR